MDMPEFNQVKILIMWIEAVFSDAAFPIGLKMGVQSHPEKHDFSS